MHESNNYATLPCVMSAAREQLDSTLRHSQSRDWERAKIIFELRRRGWTLRKLSASHGYRPGTLSDALYRHWPR
ncbi:MAG TPA: helix-turn-helix domain-containing protein, partial [Chloroflexota bacterium]|nr:helix-turn-helix domain-containing protein [Chloroflexota bacterium]